MDPRTRKLMTMHEALYPRDDVVRLYLSRKEGWRGLNSIEDRVDALIQWLEDDTGKHERTDYSHQKQYWQCGQQNDNNKETKMGRKTIQWAF